MTLILLILVTVLVVGGAFAAVRAMNGSKKKAAAGWAQAPGVITVSQVYEERDRDTDGAVSHTWLPQLRYTYSVNGAEHQGTRVAFANTRSSNRGKAQAWCDRFPVGAQVTVYYDPAKPQDSVLDRGEPAA